MKRAAGEGGTQHGCKQIVIVKMITSLISDL